MIEGEYVNNKNDIEMFIKDFSDKSFIFRKNSNIGNYNFIYKGKSYSNSISNINYYNALLYNKKLNSIDNYFLPIVNIYLNNLEYINIDCQEEISNKIYNIILVENYDKTHSIYKSFSFQISESEMQELEKDILNFNNELTNKNQKYNEKFKILEYRIISNRIFIGFTKSYLESKIKLYLTSNINELDLTEKDVGKRNKIITDKITFLTKPYLGKTTNEISNDLGCFYSGKSANRQLFNRMINIDSQLSPLFLKNNIQIKTITLNNKKRPNESMSFSSFKYNDLIDETWEESQLYEMFNKTLFVFVIFKEVNKKLTYMGFKTWTMPESDLNSDVKFVWNHTRDIIKSGNIVKEIKNKRRYTNFIGLKDNKIVHVRPHASSAKDTFPLPTADLLTGDNDYMKHCFWLNSSYIMSIISDKSSPASSLEKINQSLNTYKSKIYIPVNKECAEGFTLENNLCYSNKYANYQEAFLQETLSKEIYYHSKSNIDLLEIELQRLTNKKILLRIDKNRYLSSKFFLNKNFTFLESTNIINNLNKLNTNDLLTKRELISLTKDEIVYNELIGHIDFKELVFEEETYLTKTLTLTFSEAVTMILNIYKIINMKSLVEKVSILTAKSLTYSQTRSAVYNSNLFYDSEFDKVFINKDEYYKFIWEDRK